jgi:hypothetical protein
VGYRRNFLEIAVTVSQLLGRAGVDLKMTMKVQGRKRANAKTMTPMGRKLLFLAVAASVIICLVSKTVFAQGFCTAASSIDGVPFFVGQAYSDILKRAPDRTGQLFHIAALEGLNTTNCKSVNPALSAGTCEWNNSAQTIMGFLSSAESIAINGTLADNTAFVTALYELLLRRDPDSAGLNYYVSLLGSKTTRVTVVSMFLSGSEYRHRFACTYNGITPPACNGAESIDPVPSFVSQSYLDLLKRPSDGTGQAWWTSQMTTNQLAMCGNTSASDFSACDRVFEAQTTLSFLGSPEYQESNPPITENGAFVTALYEHLLQRAPDQTGLQYYTHYLNQTSDRVGAIYAFLTSNEYRERFACYAGASDELNFGINGHPFTGLAYSNSVGVDFSVQMSLIQNANLTWYRVDVAAPPPGGDYSQMDLLLSTAQTYGIQLLPILFPVVNRDTDTLAELYSESYSGAFNFVSRYKTSIHVWELSNEEDLYTAYQYGDPYGKGKWLWGAPPGDSVGDYYPPRVAISEAIIHGLADGVRAADPSAVRVVNFAWIHTGFIQLLEDDAIPYDIIGIHWYSNADVKDDTGMGDITCPSQGLPCPSQPILFNVIQRLQSLTNGKPLWLTENNYQPVPSNSVPTNIVWEENYLPPMLQTYLNSPSVYPYQMVMIYELLDEPYQHGPNFAQMGLYQDTESNGYVTLGAPKPAYQSVQQLLSGR